MVQYAGFYIPIKNFPKHLCGNLWPLMYGQHCLVLYFLIQVEIKKKNITKNVA